MSANCEDWCGRAEGAMNVWTSRKGSLSELFCPIRDKTSPDDLTELPLFKAIGLSATCAYQAQAGMHVTGLQ